MSYSPSGGQWPSYPSHQPYQPYQPYASYQPYPYQPQPLPPNQPYLPKPEAQPNEGPLPEMPQGLAPGHYASVFAVVLVAVCLGALVLAAVAPALTARPEATVPSDWGKVYDGGIHADGVWDTAGGCRLVSAGLDAQADTSSDLSCDYKPSESLDVLSQGFYIQAQVAPAAQVEGMQVPLIAVGQNDDIYAAVDQDGNYWLCVGRPASCRQNGTVAWHSDGFVPNTLGLLYVPGAATSESGTLTLFGNGQALASLPSSLPSSGATLSLGAERGSEALFTHVTLYLASSH